MMGSNYCPPTISLTVLLYLFTLDFLTANLISDLESRIGDGHCIEASVLYSSLRNEPTLVLDKESVSKSSVLNFTVSKNENFEKSMGTKINELAQYNNIEYVFKLVQEEGPPHHKTFRVKLTLGEETYDGEGSSLRRAQESAAAKAIDNTQYDHPPVRSPDGNKVLTPTVILNNVATKLGITVSYDLITDKNDKEISHYSLTEEAYGKTKKSYLEKLNHSIYHNGHDLLRVPKEEPQLAGPFVVKVTVDGDEFVGSGHTIQGARHDAAFKALDYMRTEILYRDNVCSKEDSVQLCKKKRDSLKSPISRIYEAGQKHNMAVEFEVIEESGPSHKRTFVTQCTLGSFVAHGRANSKKESKKIAAEMMVKNLTDLPEITDGSEIVNALKSKKKRRKKRRISKDDVEKLGGTLQDMLSLVWGSSNEESDKSVSKQTNSGKVHRPSKKGTDFRSGQTVPSKASLLEVTNGLGLEIHFSDLTKDNHFHFTLLSLGINPLYVCLGKGLSYDAAHNDAAAHGFRFLHKHGLLDKLHTAEVPDEQILYGSVQQSEQQFGLAQNDESTE